MLAIHSSNSLSWAKALLCCAALSCCGAPPAYAQRYQGWLRDGQPVTGEKISGWMTETGGGTLDGKNLFEPANPVRTLHDTTAREEAIGPLVQTTNGDILPGRLTSHEPAGGHFVVTLDGAAARDFEPPQLLLHEAALSRLALAPVAPRLKAGEVELADGRRFLCRAIRVQGQRLQLLTKEGVSTVPLGEVRQLEMPGESLDDVLADSFWSSDPAPTGIIHIRTAGGARITVPKALARVIEIDGKKWFYLRPTWAVHTFRILRDRIA